MGGKEDNSPKTKRKKELTGNEILEKSKQNANNASKAKCVAFSDQSLFCHWLAGKWVKMHQINLVHPGSDAYDISWAPWGFQKLLTQCVFVLRQNSLFLASLGALKGGKYVFIWFILHP